MALVDGDEIAVYRILNVERPARGALLEEAEAGPELGVVEGMLEAAGAGANDAEVRGVGGGSFVGGGVVGDGGRGAGTEGDGDRRGRQQEEQAVSLRHGWAAGGRKCPPICTSIT